MRSMNPRVIKTNIKELKGLEDQSDSGFGRRIPLFRKLEEWKKDPRTRSTHVSQKRQSLAKALKEFRELYDVSEFYADFGKNDDTFKVFFRTKSSTEVFGVEHDGEIYQAVVPSEFSEHSYPFNSPDECFEYLTNLRKKLGPVAQNYPLVPYTGAV